MSEHRDEQPPRANRRKEADWIELPGAPGIMVPATDDEYPRPAGRGEGQSCGTCRFFVLDRPGDSPYNDLDSMGRCLRYPAAQVGFLLTRELVEDMERFQVALGVIDPEKPRPLVFRSMHVTQQSPRVEAETGWCGEWRGVDLPEGA